MFETWIQELNWNLGCHPMVTKSGMGSGLISNTEKINHILERAHTESDILVSMKMRLGMNRLKKLLMYFLFLTNIL
jgi:tRNA-dihydrouridine synthase